LGIAMSKSVACPERRALERELVSAVEAVYRAVGGNDRAAALILERCAVKALEAHIAQHGCEEQGPARKP